MGCYLLAKINVSMGNPYLETICGVLFSKPFKRILCYPDTLTDESYSIPQGIWIIGSMRFMANGLNYTYADALE